MIELEGNLSLLPEEKLEMTKIGAHRRRAASKESQASGCTLVISAPGGRLRLKASVLSNGQSCSSSSEVQPLR